MLTQTKEVRDAWRASQRTLDIKVAVNGKTYTATDINSLKYDSGAYTGDTFAIGSTYSNSVQIEFSHLIENLKLGMEVLPSIGIKTSSGYVYEPLGVFIISSEIKMDRNNNLTSISASDRFCGLEGSYKSKLAYPAKVLDVIAEICEQSGVKANVDNLARLPHQADLPRPITGQTYRKALGWIAQLYAGYATFDRKGLFTIRTIAEPNYELDPSQYEQAGLTKNEAPYRISGIQCQTTITTKTRDGEDTDETKNYQVGDTNGSQIKLENNIMTPDRLTNIWEQIKDVNFYPFSLNWFGNPAIEAGDWLKLQDKQGNKFIVPNNSYTLDFNGGLSATSKADQTSSTDSVIAWEGTFSQTIRELQDRKAPDGTVIFPPSVTEPPTNAKPNDVWFKQNGNSTELWVFTEQEDGTRKWIRRDLTPDEIKKQVQEAQDGLKDAKKEIADNLAKADSDIAELNASIDNQNSKIDGLSTSVNTVVIPKVTDITNQVSDVVTKVNEQKNIVIGLQNQATQQGKDISKITTDVHGVTVDLANLNGDVNQTKATVQGLQTTLGNAQGDIAQIKVDAKKLSTSLSGKVDTSTYANFVNATNSALNAKLVASDLNGYAKTTDVQATANGLQININSLSGKLDNLVIGNRNLVRNSGFPKNTNYWSGPATTRHDFYYSSKQTLFVLNNSSENFAESAYFPLERNTDYVVSFKGFASTNVSSYDVFILARKYGENTKYTTVKHLVDAKRLSPSKVDYIKDLIFNSGENDEAYIRFDNNGSSDGKQSGLYFTEVKVEQGNKSTAWTPAPEDEQERINGITSQLSARITANSQQFSSYYSKTDVDHKVSGVQSQITQNANNINLKVNAVGDLSNICLNPNFDDGSTAGWENISSSTGNSISPSKYYGGISIRDGFYGNMFSVSAGDKYYFSIYAWQDQSSHNFSVGFTYLQKDGSWNWQSALTFSPSESGREKTGAITIPSNAVKARIWVQIDADSDYGHWWFTNVNVRKNDTLAQINMSAGTTLIQNDKIYMDASSTVFSGKAFIPNAAITNISADKINAGTLDAGRINVINLNANNITTGTINGANLKINLNDGEILFQKGRIASTNGNLNIDLDNGTMSVTNYWGMGVFFQNGQLILDDRNSLGLAGSYSDANPKYGIIKRSYDLFSSGLYGMDLLSPNGVSLKTTNYDGIINSGTMLDSTTSGAVMTVDKNGSATVNAAGTTHLVGGNKFKSIPSDNSGITTNRPHIWIGNFNGDVGDRIEIDANYVHMPTTYWRTTGAAPNLHIADDGALVRSTSASKYKTNIKRSYSTEYGDKLLNLPTAIWTDKGQKERYEAGKRHIKPEKYLGMIAEDLADAGLDLLVSRNPKTHEIEGIQYERIAPALLPVIKKLKDKVNRLEKQINE
ncbi:gp58-like family protein [Lactobacillus gasseri]|uniref:Peptidase n=1 Tax=Lactobacillus gasseri TaxID=1596 RepID=A0A8A4UZ79_LACGS|nr:gp58-like family protein [Lactobacillus gasseri]QTD66358.1 peptidase [Lactobacillus gasseri]